ncbi:S-adenosyl-L-methionine-dependent methyltransferase [Mycotypha africana]|uniref:S-adenosyl-L-methionine-dependent methyltransferase n=1 Tax=Mycotypha africana TaxID=64632 RepID=UPI002301C0FC|nr:S-adenosyl-L-methionine-dependent methyltransferase [Mycotypha africana]KAI8992007.1 S-adenosyl-L-methionine-dependent methyltransferase [Mycotypha africana]
MTPATTTRLYATLDSKAFVYQVKVNNLPQGHLREIIDFFKDKSFRRFHKDLNATSAYVNCDSEQAAKLVMQELEGIKFQNKWTLSTEYTKLSQSEFRKAYLQKSKKDKNSTRKVQQNRYQTVINKIDPKIRIAQSIAPMHQRPYSKQLERKERFGQKYLTQLIKSISVLRPGLDEKGRAQIAWVNEPCPFLGISPSPLLAEYKTDCTFTIGRDLQDNVSVGFLLGPDKNGEFGVIQPDKCPDITKKAKEIADVLKTYIKESKYDVYDPIKKKGLWHSVAVRTQSTGDVMISVNMYANQLTQEELAEEKQKLQSYWEKWERDDKNAAMTLLLQTVQKDDTENIFSGFKIQSTDILRGKGYVYEEIQKQKFRISANTTDDFLGNIYVVETILNNIKEWCGRSVRPTALLNFGCGVGIISNLLAKSMDEVFGVDESTEALKDAVVNAKINNVHNVTYCVGEIENKLRSLNLEEKDIIAVIKASQEGMDNSLIAALRSADRLQKIIYLSFDPKKHMDDFKSLCRPLSSKFLGKPFKPSKAMIIDSFPQKTQLLFMIEFERAVE